MTPYLMTNFSLNPQTPSVFNVFHGMRSDVILRAGGGGRKSRKTAYALKDWHLKLFQKYVTTQLCSEAT